MPELIDQKVFDELKMLIKERFPGLLEKYVHTADGYVQQIREGFLAQDAQKIIENAHPLKSSSGSLGLKKMQIVCEKIERMAQDVQERGAGFEGLEPLIQALESVYAQSVEWIKGQI